MSAGGLSYSGITNYGKATLPSVEAGLGSMNILRDPPKSIHTRRINKVGETSSITEMVDQSGNRSCEAISVYARGVNPMVSVDYGNSGTNGGQRVSGGGLNSERGGSGNTACGSGQAYLPYRVARDGAFRPPIMRQEQLLPLSRQRRTNTDAFTKSSFIDYSKKLECPGGNYRAVKQETLSVCVRPTATYKLETPIAEPFEVKYVIKNPTKFDSRAGVSGMRTQDLTTQNMTEHVSCVNNTPLQLEDVNTNQSDKTRYVDHSHMNTDRYIQDTLHSSVKSKVSQSIQIMPIEDIFDVDIRTKDPLNMSCTAPKNGYKKQDYIHKDIYTHTKDPINVSYTAPKNGHDKQDYIHKDMELQRRVLAATMATNKHRNIYSRPEIQHQAIQKRNRPLTTVNANHGTINRQSSNNLNNREYRLQPTIAGCIGGFTGRGQKHSFGRNQQVNENFQSDRMKMSKRVMEMQFGRNF